MILAQFINSFYQLSGWYKEGIIQAITNLD